MQTRQKEILELIVNEYIKTAEPVGSEFLVEKYKLDFSPATVRNEMLELTETNYLFQPHTSAGRVPTDKGYRFFVDRLFEENLIEENEEFLKSVARVMKQWRHEQHRVAKEMAKTISFFSHSVGMCGFIDEDEFYSTGLSNLLKEPEFSNNPELSESLEIFDSLEQEINKIIDKINEDVKVFIGKEGGRKKLDDFSIILSSCRAKKRKSVVGVLGLKRMNYARNIALINLLKEVFNRKF